MLSYPTCSWDILTVIIGVQESGSSSFELIVYEPAEGIGQLL